jgi:hypothetical protein
MTDRSDQLESGEASNTQVKWPAWWILGLQLAALWSLGLVRPLFDVLGTDNAFFVARGNTPGDILIFAIGVTLIPPLVLTLIELIVRAASLTASRIVHLVFVALLTALIALQFVKGSFAASTPALLVALAIGLLVAFAFWKTVGMRSFMTILTPATFIFLALFIFASPVSDVIMPSSEGSGSAGAQGQSGNSTPVVLVIYDEFPVAMMMDKNTNINASRFPAFANLGKTSTWYKNNTTVSDSTFSAVPAILTGIVPADKPQKDVPVEQSIYTFLAASHRVGNVEPITHVCPPSICEPAPVGDSQTRLTALYDDLLVVAGRTVLPKALADQLPAVDSTYGDFAPVASDSADPAEALKVRNPKARFADTPPIADVNGASSSNDRLRIAAKMQNSISGDGKAPLYVLHMLIPHVPWRFMASGDQYLPNGNDAPGLTDALWSSDTYLTNLALQRALLQAEFADTVLASIVKRMKQAGIWERSLLIVTADHGASFRPGGSRRPVTQQNLPELSNTPLFVKAPGQTSGTVSTAPTRSVDIAPTIAEVTKTGAGLKFDGIPLSAEHTSTAIAVRNGRQQRKVRGQSAEVMKRRDQLVAEWTTTFPGGQDGLYRLGPNQGLIGKRVASLPTTSSSASGVINHPELYSRIDRASGVLQIYLTGSTSGLAAKAPLAAAVNGRIVAVGESFDTPRGVQFGIILPPATLRGTSARVQLFTVSGGSTLAPLASAGR